MSKKFDSILICCPQILGYKTHLKITTDSELHVKQTFIDKMLRNIKRKNTVRKLVKKIFFIWSKS